MAFRPLLLVRLDAAQRTIVAHSLTLTLVITSACGATPAAPADGAAPAPDTAAPCAAGNLTCDPLTPFPAMLTETGLAAPAPKYVDPRGGHAYTPAPELYSDGLHKERFVLLPAGKKVDTGSRAAWQFPTGTIFVKTFFDEGGPGGARRPVETRLIRNGSDRFEPFEYAVYQWNEDASRAQRLDIAGNRRGSAPVVIASRRFTHTIPSQNDCAECHGRNALTKSTVIGFDELRLNHGETRSQLAELATKGLFSTALPATPLTISDPDPVLAQVKRFVFGNCVHCHNGQRNLIDLHPDVLLANTIDQAPESPGTAVPPHLKRIVPGRPEDSVVFLQTRGTDLPLGMRPMPQIGVEVRDLPVFAAELENMKAWIRSLPLR